MTSLNRELYSEGTKPQEEKEYTNFPVDLSLLMSMVELMWIESLIQQECSDLTLLHQRCS